MLRPSLGATWSNINEEHHIRKAWIFIYCHYASFGNGNPCFPYVTFFICYSMLPLDWDINWGLVRDMLLIKEYPSLFADTPSQTIVTIVIITLRSKIIFYFLLGVCVLLVVVFLLMLSLIILRFDISGLGGCTY